MARKTRGKLGGGNFLGRFDGLPFTKPYGAWTSGEKGDEPFQKAKPGSICSFPMIVRPPPEGKAALKAEKKRAAKVLSRAVAKRKAAARARPSSSLAPKGGAAT